MSDHPEKDWVARIGDWLDAFSDKVLGPDANRIADEMLEDGWQRQTTLEAFKPMSPTLEWPKKGEEIEDRARFIGGLVGHAVAHQNAMCEPSIWKLVGDAQQILQPTEKVSNCGDGDGAYDNPFLRRMPSFRAMLAKVMRSVSRQSATDQIQFFRGYTKALEKGALTAQAKGVEETTRTSAYQLLAAFGPVLKDEWKSVHDVHRFLEHFLGPQRAGDAKRTEAICKSIGLKFRGPGRPSKSPRDLGAEESCS
jgi:hypothetical protein